MDDATTFGDDKDDEDDGEDDVDHDDDDDDDDPGAMLWMMMMVDDGWLDALRRSFRIFFWILAAQNATLNCDAISGWAGPAGTSILFHALVVLCSVLGGVSILFSTLWRRFVFHCYAALGKHCDTVAPWPASHWG